MRSSRGTAGYLDNDQANGNQRATRAAWVHGRINCPRETLRSGLEASALGKLNSGPVTQTRTSMRSLLTHIFDLPALRVHEQGKRQPNRAQEV